MELTVAFHWCDGTGQRCQVVTSSIHSFYPTQEHTILNTAARFPSTELHHST